MYTELKEKTKQSEYLACEQWWVFMCLIFVGGYFGAFTYCLRGGVFCNAQTANMLLVGVSLGQGDISEALKYFISIASYFIGVVIAEIMPNPVRKTLGIRWDTLLIALEIAAVAALGFLPESAPHRISQIAVNIITAMQFTTFRQAQGEVMSTTFCTNHLRQTGTALVKWAKKPHPKRQRQLFLRHISMICIFILGAFASYLLGSIFGGKSVWFSAVPLAAVLIYLLYADLRGERDRLDAVPKGH